MQHPLVDLDGAQVVLGSEEPVAGLDQLFRVRDSVNAGGFLDVNGHAAPPQSPEDEWVLLFVQDRRCAGNGAGITVWEGRLARGPESSVYRTPVAPGRHWLSAE